MEVEQLEIREQLRRYPPFSFLPEELLNKVAGKVEIAYYRADSEIVQGGQEIDALGFIRKGAVELFRRSGAFYNRLDEGEIFGQFSLLTGQPARFPARAAEDALIYFIPAKLFKRLYDEVEAFAEFVEVEDRTRLRQAGVRLRAGNDMLTTKVARMINREPISVRRDQSVREAAQLMTEQGVSSVLVDAGEGAALGIITDSDLRRRVVAEGLDGNTPVEVVMSPADVTIGPDQFLFDALLAMMRSNVHHLPVVERGQVVGVIDLADVVGQETRNSLFVIRNILDQRDLDGLVNLLPDVRGSFLRMVTEGATAQMIGSAVATIGRSFKQRLLTLAEEDLGPPPVPYCFLALGSMARDEQSLVTDQDHAIVLADDFDRDRHDDYFRRLGEQISDGLDALNYPYCKGNIMASNPDLRQPLKVWQDRFAAWIARPNTEALLNSSIYFDLAGVHGKTDLADQLRQQVTELAPKAAPFLGCMAHNAQARTPPLGFFRDFVLDKGGRHHHTLDLKRRGTAPLVDVIRTHALAAGSMARNSFRRLDDIRAAGFLTTSMTADLRDALEFIALMQYRHHAYLMEQGKTPDNKLNPETLDTFDRRNLKDAFRVLANAQRFLKMRYRLLPT
ncbi:MAG: cyclic nucleotide-binding/CBS domain-containing protein [Wenzhouxiangella sp.]|nr:MAG: cyclic nucleotide-binding/CBS domain-containing protein [Wenzhouxiangella sp.]